MRIRNQIPLFAMAVGGLLPQAFRADVRVLADFEQPTPEIRWSGSLQVSATRSSHGRQSARISNSTTFTSFPNDWSTFDRLLFDMYSEREAPSTASVRIYDNSNPKDSSDRNSYFDARNKLLLIKGWNHIEIRLTNLQAESYQRPLDLRHINRVVVGAESASTLYIDNLRLVSGEDKAPQASRQAPQDAVCVVDNRWVTVRQVAPPENVPESRDVAQLRTQAQREKQLLQLAIDAARLQGIETIYQERHLVTADLGLTIRPALPWFNNDESKKALFSYVAASCRTGRREIEDQLMGIGPRRELDDTQMPPPLVPPLPPLKGRPMKDGFFRDEQGGPLMVLSVHSPSRVLQRFFDQFAARDIGRNAIGKNAAAA